MQLIYWISCIFINEVNMHCKLLRQQGLYQWALIVTLTLESIFLFLKRNTNFNKGMLAYFLQRHYLKGGHILRIWLLLSLYPRLVYYIG